MEKKEQDAVAPEIQQAENVSYNKEIKDSHIDMNPLHGAEAEAAAKMSGNSILAEPNVAQVVEPLTGSAVVIEEKPKVPDNGFPVGYGPNEHMKKIEKPKKPSIAERMKHARKKMSKKQKILMIAIPSATVLLVGGFILFAVLTGMFKTDYSGTYLAAKNLKSEMQKLRSDANCDKVIEYVNNQYTTMQIYQTYIDGCQTIGDGVESSVVEAVGETAGVLKDEEVRRRYETLKTALDAARDGNKELDDILKIYATWHEWRIAEYSGNNAHQEWDWTDSDLKKASEILTNSETAEFKKYGEEWYALKKTAAEATNAYYHRALDTSMDLPTLTKNMSDAQDAFNKFKKEKEPNITELYPLELVDTAKLYAKFEEFYNYIKETYQNNYNSEVGGCKELVTSVVCE